MKRMKYEQVRDTLNHLGGKPTSRRQSASRPIGRNSKQDKYRPHQGEIEEVDELKVRV